MPDTLDLRLDAILSSLQNFTDFAEASKNTKGKPVDLPELSHYCDLHALKSILTNNELWGSNIRFLNDKQEMKYGIEVAKEVMNKLLNRLPPGPNSPTRRAWKIPPIPDVYAVCFCRNPDLLSQWRGYGSAQQSVSIQFDGPGLAALGYVNRFRLNKVVYGEKSAVDMLERELALIDKKAKNAVKQIIENTTFDTKAEQTKAILRLSPQFKNEHFDEEDEWRLISDIEEVVPEYRPRDNVLLPYAKIKYADNRPLPILGITVGPGKDSALTQESIEHFLKSKPLYRNVKVDVSKIPFRV